jgi:hypothetical protein
MSDKEPLKITIEDIEDEEKPVVAERPQQSGRKLAGDVASTAGKSAGRAGKKAAVAAGDLTRKAWESDARRKATDKLATGATTVTHRSAELVRDKVAEVIEEQARATATAVETRVREVDWQAEAQKAAVGGLRWLGRRLEELAQRFSQPNEKK